jgi:hypothetical protein
MRDFVSVSGVFNRFRIIVETLFPRFHHSHRDGARVSIQAAIGATMSQSIQASNGPANVSKVDPAAARIRRR